MVKALIAVRAGSERVKNKNIRPFAGKSLLEYKILQLKRLSCLDGIVVNSEDITMLKIAASLGCEVVQREKRYAASDASMSENFVHMAQNFPGDIVVYSNVTSPLIQDSTIKQAVALYLQMEGKIESVNTVNSVKNFLYLNDEPLNFDPKHHPRTQDLPDIYMLNFALNIISRENMIRYRNVISPKHKFLQISDLESTDIDTELDFEVAELLFRKKNGLELL